MLVVHLDVCDICLRSIFDSIYVLYDVWISNLISIFCVSLNPINSCVKSLHSHAIVSLVLMDFGFNLEVVLHQICMRDIL